MPATGMGDRCHTHRSVRFIGFRTEILRRKPFDGKYRQPFTFLGLFRTSPMLRQLTLFNHAAVLTEGRDGAPPEEVGPGGETGPAGCGGWLGQLAGTAGGDTWLGQMVGPGNPRQPAEMVHGGPVRPWVHTAPGARMT